MGYTYYPVENLRNLSNEMFKAYGYNEADSAFITDVILSADLYGIESHGVNRLQLYPYSIDIGRIKTDTKCEIVLETPVSATIDAHDSEGHLASRLGMELAIRKAKETGIGMVTVRNSNHYGIAGYYSRMALQHRLMGISMTNAEALVIPTFGKRPMMGTNPIAVSMPAEPIPYTLDMSTAVIPSGKIEVYAKNGKDLPEGFVLDSDGVVCTDPNEFLKIRKNKTDGGLLPLGGFGETYSGQKGYGLGVLVELMCGNFSGGLNADRIRVVPSVDRVCHFFGAIDYGIFGDKAGIEAEFSDYLQRIRDSAKAKGFDRIYTHGEKEMEKEREVLRRGIGINEPTLNEIIGICEKHGVDYKRWLCDDAGQAMPSMVLVNA